MYDRSQIHEGMAVRNTDGERLGKITAVMDDGFEYTKGHVLPEHYFARYVDVLGVKNGALVVSLTARLPEEPEAGDTASQGYDQREGHASGWHPFVP